MPMEKSSSPQSPCRLRNPARISTATANRTNPTRTGPRRKSGLLGGEQIAMRKSAPVQTQNVEEETRQDRLESERAQGHAGNDPAQRARIIEVAKVDQPPRIHGEQQQTYPDDQDRRA